MRYLYGQTVIVGGDTLAVVIPPPNRDSWDGYVWVRRIHDSVEQYYAIENVRPYQPWEKP